MPLLANLKYYATQAAQSIAQKATQVYHSSPVVVGRAIVYYSAKFVSATVTQSYQFAKFVYQSPEVHKTIKDGAVNSWRGFTSLRIRALYHMIKGSKELQSILQQSAIANLVTVALPVIVYEGWVKPALRLMDPALANSSLEMSYDYPIKMMSVTFAAGSLLKNISYSIQLNSATAALAAAENKNVPCPHMQSTASLVHLPKNIECALKGIKADTESATVYPRNLFTAAIAGSFLGNHVANIIRALVYGESYLDIRYSASGTCTECRICGFANNKMYEIGAGAALMIATKTFLWLLTKAATVCRDSELDAVSSGLLELVAGNVAYQLFSMLAYLQQNTPGKQDESGLDLFKYNRYEVRTALSQIAQAVIEDDTRARIKAYGMRLLRFPPVKISGLFVLGVTFFPGELYRQPELIFNSKKLFSAEVLLRILEVRAIVQPSTRGLEVSADVVRYARTFSLATALAVRVLLPAGVGEVAHKLVAGISPDTLRQIKDIAELGKRNLAEAPPEAKGGVAAGAAAADVDYLEKAERYRMVISADVPAQNLRDAKVDDGYASRVHDETQSSQMFVMPTIYCDHASAGRGARP